MNEFNVLLLNDDELSRVAMLLAMDKAYLDKFKGQTCVVLMEGFMNELPWSPLPLEDVRVILQHPSLEGGPKLGLTAREWVFLTELLIADVIFMTRYNPRTDRHDGLASAILINDIFHYAADAESVKFSDIERLHRIWRGDINNIIRFVADKRGYRPLKKALRVMCEEGYNLDWINQLKENS